MGQNWQVVDIINMWQKLDHRFPVAYTHQICAWWKLLCLTCAQEVELTWYYTCFAQDTLEYDVRLTSMSVALSHVRMVASVLTRRLTLSASVQMVSSRVQASHLECCCLVFEGCLCCCIFLKTEGCLCCCRVWRCNLFTGCWQLPTKPVSEWRHLWRQDKQLHLSL